MISFRRVCLETMAPWQKRSSGNSDRCSRSIRLLDECRLDDDSARSTLRMSGDGGVRRNLADDLATLDEQPEDLRSIHFRRVSQLSNNGMEYGDTQDLDDLGTPSSQEILTREPSASDTAVRSHSDASHFQSSGLGGRNLRYACLQSIVSTSHPFLRASVLQGSCNRRHWLLIC